MKNTNKELISLLFIAASGSIMLGVFALLLFGLIKFYQLPNSGWYLFFYLLIVVGCYYFSRHKKIGIASKIYKTAVFPFKILQEFIRLSAPYLVIQTHLALYLFFSFVIPASFFIFDQTTKAFQLNTPTHVYIFVTLSVVIATLGNKRLKKLILIITPFKWDYLQRYTKIDFKELTNYLLSENNIKFIIYSAYFTYLLIINFFNFQENSFYSNPETDKAVLQSFITFIALERLLTNLKEINFKPSELIKKLLDAMSKGK